MKVFLEHEWQALGESLFGDNKFTWRFICPVCGNVQTPQDFHKYKENGAKPSSAFSECIGRYENGRRLTEDGRPCDYAAYGLFNLCPWVVKLRSGESINVFKFDGAENEK